MVFKTQGLSDKKLLKFFNLFTLYPHFCTLIVFRVLLFCVAALIMVNGCSRKVLS